MGKTGEWTLALLRIATGAMLCIYHGWGKLLAAWGYVFSGAEWGFVGFVASLGFPLAGFFAVCAALAESVAAVLLAAGLWTRYVAVVVAGNMAVAVYHHARSDGKFELALFYLLVALVFATLPAGRFSLDALLGARRSAGQK
jgi:putative oxidoreductase